MKWLSGICIQLKLYFLILGATEQNTNCTQNLDAPHKPTTDENSGKL